MGTWNATCGVTQLPILEGERAAMMPLVVNMPDFLARDCLGGAGSSDNALIARPFTLPVFGPYDGVGGVNPDAEDPGFAYLMQSLTDWQDKGVLRINDDGHPVPVKPGRFDPQDEDDQADLLQKLVAGELFLAVPNVRRGWLKTLHKTYAELSDEQKPGFSHYLPQMQVDPDSLPEHLESPLAVMLVPEKLYRALALRQGSEEAEGYRSAEANIELPAGTTRAQELTLWSAHQPVLAAKYQDFVGQLDALNTIGAELREETGGEPLTPRDLREMLAGAATLQPAVRLNEEIFQDSLAPTLAVMDAVLDDNAKARALWAEFHHFAQAFDILRKQWTPQSGAGNSSSYEYSADLYRTVAAHMHATLAHVN